MKIFFTLLLLALTGILHAQQINTIEYFFDNDPGVGSGTKMTLNSATLDSTVNFAISGLTSGVHILNIRLKNSSNTWGTTYQSPVLIATGTDGSPTITNAEYFFDTDPGFGKGQSMAVNQAALDSVLNLPITGLTSGVHLLNIRLKDANNSWSTTYQSGILIVNGAVGNTTIVSAEYYFDKDPGFGNGQSLPINKAALDSVVNFSVTGLTPGSHTIYVRLKNSSDSWSFAGQGSFLLSDGTPGIPQVKSLEYFSNADSGVSKNAILPLTPGASLDTSISVFVADNNTDSSILGLRLANQTGQIGNVALTSINLCDLYKPVGGFRRVRFGNSYSFVDSSLYNTTKQIRWMVNNVVDTLYNNSTLFNYTAPSGFVGTMTIGEIVGSGCRVDTTLLEIQGTGIESFSPYMGAVGRDFVLNIYGAGLDTLATVFLQHGSTVIYPYDKSAYDGKLLSAIFDFHNAPASNDPFHGYTDTYELHVHFSDGRDTVILQAVGMVNALACALYGGLDRSLSITCDRVAEANGVFVTADLTGPDAIRTGIWNYYSLNVANVGYSLAKETPVWIYFPAEYDVQFDLNWRVPAAMPDSALVDSFPPDVYTAIDTVIDGVHRRYKVYGLIPPFINPGQTWTVDFKIRTTQLAADTIEYWVQQPMFGSPPGPGWLGCLHDGLGYAPIIGCGVSLYDYLVPDKYYGTSAGFPASYRSDFSHGILRGAFKDAQNFTMTLGGVALSCSGASKAAAKVLSTDAVKKLTNFEKWADRTNSTYQNGVLAKCGPPIAMIKKKLKDIAKVLSFDPNHLVGNSDYDDVRHFVGNFSPQNYRVSFENNPSATAPAQHVYIVDTLDPAKFVLSTFRFTGYRIGDSSYPVPPTRGQVIQTAGIKYYNDVQVQFVGSLDTTTGIVRMDFFTMDATGTRLVGDSSLKGFLPPDIDGMSGTGEIGFSVFAENLPTLSTFSNRAVIYFDNNAPIPTNTWMNTIDKTAPTGSIVKAIPVNDSTVNLVVQKGDVGSGFNFNELFVKGPGDTVFNALGQGSGDTLTFVGTPNQAYQVFTKAFDKVGNRQIKDSVADLSFTVMGTPLPTHLLSFTGQKVDTRVKLQWSAVNEVNFSHYDVERSGDGVTFTKIGTVAAQGGALTNYYQLYDEHPLPASNYYRLRQVENSGAFSFSRVIRIDFDKAFTVAVTPVPAQNYIIIDGAENFRQVQLVDMSGRIVKQFSTTSGNTFNVQDLSAGMYLVRLVSDSGITTLKMLKE